jgi:hypothetical protein
MLPARRGLERSPFALAPALVAVRGPSRRLLLRPPRDPEEKSRRSKPAGPDASAFVRPAASRVAFASPVGLEGLASGAWANATRDHGALGFKSETVLKPPVA